MFTVDVKQHYNTTKMYHNFNLIESDMSGLSSPLIIFFVLKGSFLNTDCLLTLINDLLLSVFSFHKIIQNINSL